MVVGAFDLVMSGVLFGSVLVLIDIPKTTIITPSSQLRGVIVDDMMQRWYSGVFYDLIEIASHGERVKHGSTQDMVTNNRIPIETFKENKSDVGHLVIVEMDV